jgi:NADH-quinone oxidoreductase subunit C
MKWSQVEHALRREFGPKILKWTVHNKTRIYVDIDRVQLVAFSRFLFETLQARFITASGLDTPRNGIEILYHFDFFQLPQVLSLRIFLGKPDPVADSIAPIIKGAEWIEREMAELLGVHFLNHPNPAHLILPEDWPENHYPLRRDS